jgi:peroxiredoxin
MRSWRYAAIVNDGVVKAWFEEPELSDNCETDPYGETSPRNILDELVAGLAVGRTAA